MKKNKKKKDVKEVSYTYKAGYDREKGDSTFMVLRGNRAVLLKEGSFRFEGAIVHQKMRLFNWGDSYYTFEKIGEKVWYTNGIKTDCKPIYGNVRVQNVIPEKLAILDAKFEYYIDAVVNNSFWIGLYSHITKDNASAILDIFRGDSLISRVDRNCRDYNDEGVKYRCDHIALMEYLEYNEEITFLGEWLDLGSEYESYAHTFILFDGKIIDINDADADGEYSLCIEVCDDNLEIAKRLGELEPYEYRYNTAKN